MVLISVNVLASKPNSNVEDDTQEDGKFYCVQLYNFKLYLFFIPF